MKSKMVSYTLETLPPITEERLEEMKRLAGRPDEEIDFSDIPELTPEQFKRAFPGSLRRFFRTHLMTRIDPEVLAWLRKKGESEDQYINDLLRREMEKAGSENQQAA